MANPRIILASQSPRRAEILRGVLPPGTSLTVVNPAIDEKAIRYPGPAALTMAIARAKNEAVAKLLSDDAIVVTADTVAVWEGEIREKPRDPAELRRFAISYGYAPVTAVTSVWVHRTHAVPAGGPGTGYFGWSGSATDAASVSFSPFSDLELDAIVKEPAFYGSAGGFLIEHPLMKDHVLGIDGDAETIQGLPGRLVRLLLRDAAEK
ncbi:MAG TPA: Maf family protein [Candidatus Paceibacterota bacterium]|nr:Maf family protein [Candidatus Paceibacterota bacterium]